MKPEIKEAIKQVVRFLTEVWNKVTGSGVSGRKVAFYTIGIFVGMFVLGFALIGGVGSAFLGAINEFADNGMTHWVIWKFALALMLTLLFVFTVGIPLMIDEARNWFTKVAACAVVIGAAVRMLSVFEPIVAGHPRASAILTVTVLILCVGAIAHMLGHGDSVKGFLWFGKILVVVFVFWLILHGSCSSATRQAPATPKPTTCTYCFGSGCEVSMPAEIVGPGHLRVRHPKYATTADYHWSLDGTGSWKSQFPDVGEGSGGFKWTSQNYKTGEFKGEEWGDKSPSEKTPVFVLCQGRVPHPDS